MIAVARIGEGHLCARVVEYYTTFLFLPFPHHGVRPLLLGMGMGLFMLEALVALALFAYLLKRKATRPETARCCFWGCSQARRTC
jgi:hypothetical protein